MDHGDVGPIVQERRHGRSIRTVPLHPQVEGPQAAQREEAILRPGHTAHRVLQEAEAVGDRLVRGDSHAQDRVGVASQILGGGVEDDVGAKRQRPLVGR